MNFALESEIRPSLVTNEKIIWTGKPKTGIRFRPSDALSIPFTLLWFGFSIFWTVTASKAGAFALFGIPFMLVGFYIAIGRFFYDAFIRSKTIYAITNNRIIVKSGIFNSRVTSYNLRTLPEIIIREKSDGSGTITIGEVTGAVQRNAWPNWPGKSTGIIIEFIDDVKTVYSIIIEQQASVWRSV